MKKIDFEAHYYTPFFQGCEGGKVLTGAAGIPAHFPGLTDMAEQRIEEMDRNGVDVQIVSLSNGLELMPVRESVEMARRVNDWLAEQIAKHPTRFRAFAQLPVFDAEASVKELEHCVKDLGFVGWNTFSNFNGATLNEERFFPILEAAQELNTFIYLHPTAPAIKEFHTGDMDVLMGLGFHFDTCITLMKMISDGIFDRLPDLHVILGHLGETWPFMFDRLNSKSFPAGKYPVPALDGGKKKKSCGEYWRTNIWCTTSGNFSAPSFRCTRDVLGIERMLLGSDYPYEKLAHTMEFLESVGMTEEEKERLYHKNAEEFFGL